MFPSWFRRATPPSRCGANSTRLTGRRSDGEFLVIVVDNGSADGTDEVATSYRPEHYRLRVVREPRVGINVARNTGIAAAPDGMVFLCDADDEVAEDWLATMASALRPGTWVAGALDYARLNSPLHPPGLERASSLRPPTDGSVRR